MKKALLLLSLFFFACYADADDLNIIKLRAGSHADFLRIVLEGPEELITKSIVSQRANSIHVAFQGSSFAINEGKVDVAFKKLGADSIIFLPGTFNGFKAFTLKYPYRLVIDVFQGAPNKADRKAEVFSKVKTVVIDPGHGGPDYGVASGGFKEKSVVLDIANKINALAQKNKLKSSLSRTGDYVMSLDERVKAAEKEDTDIFLSLHIGNHKEIVLYVPLVTESYPENIRPYLANRGQYNYQSSSNALLNAMQRSFSDGFGSDMVIVRPLPYSILSNVGAAALMIELPSFEDASYINEFESDIAGALYNGIYIYEEIAKE